MTEKCKSSALFYVSDVVVSVSAPTGEEGQAWFEKPRPGYSSKDLQSDENYYRCVGGMPYTRFFTDSIRMLLVDCERGWPQPLPLDPPQEEFSHPYYHFRRCGDVLIELVADNDALLSRMIERLEKLG